MTELELERRVTGGVSVMAEKTRNVEALPDHIGEDVKNVFPEMAAEEQADSTDEEEVAIGMEISEIIDRGRKDRLAALRNVPKKKLLEKTAKVDKVLSKFKTDSITMTNQLFYAGAVVAANRLGVAIDKVAGRKEPM